MFRIDPVIRSLLVLLACLVALFAFLLGGRFFSFANLQSMAFQLPELGILAVAMMVTMMTGGINLSIITTANLAGITAAFCITRLAGADASSGAVLGITAIAFASAMVVSALVGAANGFVVAHLGVSAILATLGTTTVLEGIGVLVTRGSVISGFPDAVLFIGNGTVFGVPVPLVIFAVCAVLVGVWLDRTPWGVGVRMTGSNANAAAFSGVDPQLEDAARTLGRSEPQVFARVTLPLARRTLLVGLALAAARALGDFGVTLMVAGNIPLRTQTLPLYIYSRVESLDFLGAHVAAALLTAVGLGSLYLVHRMEGSHHERVA